MVQQNWVYPSQHSWLQEQLPDAHPQMSEYAVPVRTRNSIGATDNAVAVIVVRARKLRLEVRSASHDPTRSETLMPPVHRGDW
jgi:hypothetical protein